MGCAYKDIFGKPRTGVHSNRTLGDMALVDTLGTFALAYFTHWMFTIPLDICIIFWFALSILLHWMFCVDTHATRWIKKTFDYK